jgi:HAD superfamily hydrolase (TIGR01509 family)
LTVPRAGYIEWFPKSRAISYGLVEPPLMITHAVGAWNAAMGSTPPSCPAVVGARVRHVEQDSKANVLRRQGRGLIIYDFDGVIADSEVLANAVLAEIVTELGRPTTLEDSYHLYMGKRLAEVTAAVEASVCAPLPDDFAADYQTRTLERFRRDLCTVAGAREHILAFPDTSKCIASSSSPDRLALCLDVLGLQSVFGRYVFSASSVARGKPHPDIFLHAAEQMGVDPSHCIVVEDSASGVEAGRAAGMTVIGLLAGAHIQPGHDQRLRRAGAHHVAGTFKEAEQITRNLLAAFPNRDDETRMGAD